MTPIEELPDPDPKDALALGSLAKRAQDYLQSHSWCKTIRAGFLARGWEGILGVFYFKIVPAKPEVDDRLWVVVGDVPPAYLACEDPPNPADALEGYVYEMRRWVTAVKDGQPVDELIPVCYADSRRPMEPTPEAAELLEKRLDFIERELVPGAE